MKRILFFTFFSLVCFPLLAGGPFMVDRVTRSGEPARWPFDDVKQKWVVKWRADNGPLNVRVDRATALSWMTDLFSKWQNVSLNLPNGSAVSTVAIEFQKDGDGKVGEDITKENHEAYTFPDLSNPMPATIIFDVDGSIIADYTGDPNAKKSIAGMGTPFPKGNSKDIYGGIILLNGLLVNGVNTAADPEITQEQFKAVILHELGHLLNLDHTQVNLESALSCSLTSECSTGVNIPTMFPELKSTEQIGLHRDDKVTISWLYPNQTFKDSFCFVQGEIKNAADGNPMPGVNVIARQVSDPQRDARSMVSGVLYPYSPNRTLHGDYILSGLLPGFDYEVIYEELASDKYKESSGFEPMDDLSPQGFGSGHIPASGGATTIRCERGGQVITMPAFSLSPTSSESENDGAGAGSIDTSEGSSGKGWCQLTSDSSFRTFNDHVLEIFWIFSLFGVFIWRRRIGTGKKSVSGFIPR